MKEQRPLPRSLLTLLCVVALALMGWLFSQYQALRTELHSLEAQLTVSLEAWQNTAAEKEELQAELKELQTAIKEAQLALEESTQKAAEIAPQLEELQAQKEALEAELEALHPSP